MDDLTILVPKKGSRADLFFSKKKEKVILFRHGHIAICDYKKGDNKEFEKYVSIWDKARYKFDLVGAYYIKDLKEMRISRGFSVQKLKDLFPNYKMKVDNDCFEYKDADITLYTPPNKDIQTMTISHMLGASPYEKVLPATQQVITLDTGDGKTFCTIATLAYLKNKAVIFVPISKVIDQWVDSFKEFTDITDKDIIVIKGSDKCDKLIDGQYNKKKIFIISTDTFTSYADKKGDHVAIDLLRKTGAYSCIIDEVHKEMAAVIRIIALGNFRMNYFLTSSFGRADRYEDRIFNLLFFGTPKFGKKIKTDEETHINILIKKYYWKPSQKNILNMYNRVHGLNTVKYEQELLKDGKDIFFAEFDKVMSWIKLQRKNQNRILILAASIDGIDKIAKHIEEFTDEYSIGTYHSKLSKDQKKENLEKDIIIATDKGLGTGADIDRLQFVINIITYSNKLGADQFPGRLRKSKDGSSSVYIELVNFDYLKTCSQFERRSPFLRKKARGKTFKII